MPFVAGYFLNCFFPLGQQVPHFVVLLLPLYIAGDLVHVPAADGESTVAALPFELAVGVQRLVDKVGRDALDLFDQVGNRDRGRELDQEVNVVGHPVDGNHRATHFYRLALDVAVEAAFDGRPDHWCPVPCGPDQVHVQAELVAVHVRPPYLRRRERPRR